jgi:4-phosphopantoate--beta-alanine ligase
MEIPTSHPRYKSLLLRHQLIDGFKAGLVIDSGLIAHGRGEAFDYLLGEKTCDFAKDAIAVTSAMLLTAKNPVFSVNGNSAAIAAKELIELTKVCNKLTLEVNLFYHSDERSKKIANHLKALGATNVVESSVSPAAILPGVESPRRKLNAEGMAKADLVLVAIEDGDRSEALVKAGYQVVSIDLNPMSRTAQATQVSIVDELTRLLATLIAQLQNDKEVSLDQLSRRISDYDNSKILNRAISAIRNGFTCEVKI